MWRTFFFIGCFFCLTSTVALGEDSAWLEAKKKYTTALKDGIDKYTALAYLKDFDSGAAAQIMVKHILTEKNHTITEQAITGLGKMTSEEAVAYACRSLERANPNTSVVRLRMLLRAVARMRNPDIIPTLTKFSKKFDDTYIVLALGGFENLREPSDKVLAAIRPFTTTKTPFNYRLAATRALAVTPLHEVIPFLLDALDTPGRIRETAARGLIAQTGQKLGMDPQAWRKWWRWEGDQFVPDVDALDSVDLDQVKLPDDLPDYYGVNIYAKRMIFIIDKSGSMGYPAYGDSQRTRLAGVKEETIRMINQLDESHWFTIVFFNSKVKSYGKVTLYQATPKAKKIFTEFINKVKPKGGSATGKAVRKTMRRFKRFADIETIFLLTDGEPSLGVQETRKIIRNAVLPYSVRVNTFGCLGDPPAAKGDHAPENPVRKFLKDVAKDSHGVFTEIK